MAINLNVSHTNLPYRIRYYGHEHYNDETALKSNDTVKGVFFARKHGNTKTYSYITQSGIKTTKTEMQLFTEDYIKDLEIDDFIVFENKKWLVVSFEKVSRVRFKNKTSWEGKIITVRS